MRKKTIIYAVASVVIVLVAACGTYLFLTHKDRDKEETSNHATNLSAGTVDQPSTPAGKKVREGLDLESKGKTKAALDKYKSASKLCDDKDKMCKTNAKLKIQQMELILKQEAKQEQNKQKTTP